MKNDPGLTALSPHDGRYHHQLTEVAEIFSEFGLIKHRVLVEVKYLIFLSDHKLAPPIKSVEAKLPQELITDFSLSDAIAIKIIEQKVKHDVKAIELFLTEKLQKIKSPLAPLVHIALTSEDINSLAYSLMLCEARKEILVPRLREILTMISKMVQTYARIPMLARTHGQVAVPTTVGKEMAVFAQRLLTELLQLEKIKIAGKLNGAVGNFNAHHVVWPKANWLKLSSQFVTSLGLQPNSVTTQILPTESYSQIFGSLIRINGILLDLSQDLWRYISDDYFVQKAEADQVGSSTMPHKINPIDFENSEGNLGLANALLTHFILKLPISRLQRDLSDSTVKRNFGIAFGYCILAYKSLAKGLTKLSVNENKLRSNLADHWQVVAEAYQVILRVNGDAQGYQKLQKLTQGKQISKENLHDFIQTLTTNSKVKNQLLAITPLNYLGLAEKISKQVHKNVQVYLER